MSLLILTLSKILFSFSTLSICLHLLKLHKYLTEAHSKPPSLSFTLSPTLNTPLCYPLVPTPFCHSLLFLSPAGFMFHFPPSPLRDERRRGQWGWGSSFSPFLVLRDVCVNCLTLCHLSHWTMLNLIESVMENYTTLPDTLQSSPEMDGFGFEQ